MHAFGLEETNLYGRAEEAGRRALALNPRDPWAVQAVTHVMEMESRLADGIDWLTSSTDDCAPDTIDRKSVESGKSVSERVDIGGSSIINNNKITNNKHKRY